MIGAAAGAVALVALGFGAAGIAWDGVDLEAFDAVGRPGVEGEAVRALRIFRGAYPAIWEHAAVLHDGALVDAAAGGDGTSVGVVPAPYAFAGTALADARDHGHW